MKKEAITPLEAIVICDFCLGRQRLLAVLNALAAQETAFSWRMATEQEKRKFWSQMPTVVTPSIHLGDDIIWGVPSIEKLWQRFKHQLLCIKSEKA